MPLCVDISLFATVCDGNVDVRSAWHMLVQFAASQAAMACLQC